jgi:hypothetical protein
MTFEHVDKGTGASIARQIVPNPGYSVSEIMGGLSSVDKTSCKKTLGRKP